MRLVPAEHFNPRATLTQRGAPVLRSDDERRQDGVFAGHSRGLAAMYATLDDRKRPYYEHRSAA
jgi:hypothetical protein